MSKLADNLELAARIVRDPTLKWQFESHGFWANANKGTIIMNVLHMGCNIRIIPEPQYVPWGLKTHPEGVVWIRSKMGEAEALITWWGITNVICGGLGQMGYKCLLSNYTLLDGSPCGTLSSTVVVED